MNHGTAGTPEHMAWMLDQMETPEYSAFRKEELAMMVHNLPQEDLRTLRAIINGKLSKRTISPEQQKKMQDARKR